MAYERDFADMYDRFADAAEYQSRAAYQLGLLRSYGIDSGLLLDMACGTGTLTRFYLEAGYDVIAADVSTDMLMLARQKLSAWEAKTLFLCQSFETLDLYGTVRACVCSLDSLNHLLTPESLFAAFRRIGMFIEPGGIFIFDVNTEFKHREILANNTFVLEDAEAFLVWQNELDARTNTVSMTLDMFFLQPDGSYLRSADDNAERAYPQALIQELLLKAGFSRVMIYGDLSLSPPGEREERICVVAEK